MSMQPGSMTHGFLLENQRFLTGVGSDCLMFRHEATGARLAAIKNGDHNKSFLIGFVTPAADSTGVPHILEHSVLSGSQKYPVRDVFAELSKSGLRTYLNAMTGDDATFYPFSTENAQEYFATIDVYMDLVLRPLLKRETFLREGWSLSKEKNGPISFNGIVFNEMKGYYSDPECRLDWEMTRNLFPDSIYAHNTGGLPDSIVDLSYEQFCKFHETYYHPSNAIIVVYGDADLDCELSTIARLLKGFTKHPPVSPVNIGKNLGKLTFHSASYPADGDLSEKTYHAIVSKAGTPQDVELCTGLALLSQILHDSNASPLRDALLDAEICREADGYFDGMYHATGMFATVIEGSEPKHAKRFWEIYKSTLQSVVKNGFDPDLVSSEVNRFLLQEREELLRSKRGLYYARRVRASIAYGAADPFAVLDQLCILDQVAKQAESGRYLENLVAKYLLNNPETVVQSLAPDPTLAAKEQASLEKKLAALTAALSPIQIEQLEEETARLITTAKTPDTPETLACLPRLKLQDVKVSSNLPLCVEESYQDVTCLFTEIPVKGIIYLHIGFQLAALRSEDLPWVDLFSTCLSEIGTAKRDADRLAIDLASCCGNLRTQFRVVTEQGSRKAKPILWFIAPVLAEQYDVALELIDDIFSTTDFSDVEKLREIVLREFTNVRSDLLSQGRVIPMTAVRSSSSEAGWYTSRVDGFDAWQALKEGAGLVERDPQNLANRFMGMKQRLFRRGCTFLHVAGNATDIALVKDKTKALANRFDAQAPEWTAPLRTAPIQKAFVTPANVVFCAQGGNFFDAGGVDSGLAMVVNSCLDNQYLYQQIRVVGGAYGWGCSYDSWSGDLILSSYRDPHVARTFDVFNGVADFIEKLTCDESSWEQLVIRTYGDANPLQDLQSQAIRSVDRWLGGRDHAFFTKRLQTILDARSSDINDSLRQAWRKWVEHSTRSVIGNEQKIRAAENLFNEIITIE